MKAVINGKAGGVVKYNLAADQTMEVMVLNDDGSPLDFSTHTVSLEVYAASNRATVSASKALSGGTAAAGHGQVVLADNEATWITLNVGVNYYGKVKIIEAGGNVVLSENSFNISVV